MTSRKNKLAKPAWLGGITKKVLLKKEGSFIKVIRDKVEQLRKGKVWVPTKKPPVISRSGNTKPGSVFAECKAFTKKPKKEGGQLWNGGSAT